MIPLTTNRWPPTGCKRAGPAHTPTTCAWRFPVIRGRTWSTSVTPHHDGTQTEHGFASLFAMPGQGLGLVWLNGRQMKAGAHKGMAAGSMGLRGALFAPDETQASETAIDDRVCECCPSAAAVTANGPIVAFRNRTSDEIRDIYVSRLVGGRWTEPRAVHDDKWRINACPVNGPALSADGRDVAIAWFTAVGDEGHVSADDRQTPARHSARQSGSTTSVPPGASTSSCSQMDRRRSPGLNSRISDPSFEFAARLAERFAVAIARRLQYRERPLERLSPHGTTRQRVDFRVDRAGRRVSGSHGGRSNALERITKPRLPHLT